MSNVRTPIVSEPSTPLESQGDGKEFKESEVQPPYTSYEKDKGKPYLVDHFELGSFWNESDMYSESYKGEVDSINNYLEHLINVGEINNSIDSVKEAIKKMEKTVGIKKDERTSMRVGKLAAYAEFLLKSNEITKNAVKYGLS